MNQWNGPGPAAASWAFPTTDSDMSALLGLLHCKIRLDQVLREVGAVAARQAVVPPLPLAPEAALALLLLVEQAAIRGGGGVDEALVRGGDAVAERRRHRARQPPERPGEHLAP